MDKQMVDPEDFEKADADVGKKTHWWVRLKGEIIRRARLVEKRRPVK